MSKLTSVTESWESFWAAVAPPDAPAVQKVDMRRAFFAGAWAVLCEVRRVGGDEVTEEAGVAHLESLIRECVSFQQLVKEARA